MPGLEGAPPPARPATPTQTVAIREMRSVACFTLPTPRRPVMCRPSCCDNSRGQGTGIAAVALILLGTFIVAKIDPIVARIVHVALEVIYIAALTAAAVLAFAVLTWLAIMTVRWWLHRY